MAGPVTAGRPVRCSSNSGVTMRPWRRTTTGRGVFDVAAGRTTRYRRFRLPSSSDTLVPAHPAGRPGSDSGVPAAGPGVAGLTGAGLAGAGLAGGAVVEEDGGDDEPVIVAGTGATMAGESAVMCHPTATPTETAITAAATPPATGTQTRFPPMSPACLSTSSGDRGSA